MSVNLFENWIEIFRAGEHTPKSGVTEYWSIDDLDEIIKNYDPKKSEAPLVIGHPKSNEPAYGWVEGLKRVGEVLLAKFKQVDPCFAKMVRNGRYKKRSVSLRGNTLNHVGFLGAVHPAVEGLADFSSSSEIFEFAVDFQDVNSTEGGITFVEANSLFDFC